MLTRKTINDLMLEAQGRLRRLEPREAAAEAEAGALLIDTRAEETRRREGVVPGSLHVPLSVLAWRVDPASGHQHPELAGREDRLILLCQQGYSSALAALTLHDLGFTGTTDVVGGFEAWAAAGLPVAAHED